MWTVDQPTNRLPIANCRFRNNLKDYKTHLFATTYGKQECTGIGYIAAHSKTLSVTQILIIIVMMLMIFTQVFLHNPINHF